MNNLIEDSSLTPVARRSANLELCAVAMIRNEVDIIQPFLNHCAELFDRIYIVDVKSSDGTKEIIESFSDPRIVIELYSVNRQEKYQGALMNSLSRKAFRDGADWVFFLDADEFVDVESRSVLENYLIHFDSDVMSLPWINLIPSAYGTYSSFDMSQKFHWSGRISRYSKIAVSSNFAVNNPGFSVLEGNHGILRDPTSDLEATRLGLPLMHIPCRSASRLKYKISSALRLTRAKHNSTAGEGSHVVFLDKLLSSGNLSVQELNYLAANYGESIDKAEPLEPTEFRWPVRRMHPYVFDGPLAGGDIGAFGKFSMSEMLLAEKATTWDQTAFVRGSRVAALVEGNQIKIVPQAVLGSGVLHDGRFPALPSRPSPECLSGDMLIDALAASFARVRVFEFSAWSQLIPILFSLFSIVRPRRYVELGVHNGMSFFGACQAVEHLGLATECIGIDSWIGDMHAGMHSPDVLAKFQDNIKQNFPNQYYIRAYFAAALDCFEDGSIDVLHIDGLHTYEAVKRDYETWLPKMSDSGIILFHDINVFDKNFYVWRLWRDLKLKYPSFTFSHQHGLGILYVGREPSLFADLLRKLDTDRTFAAMAQIYFEAVGTLLIDHRLGRAELDRILGEMISSKGEAERLQIEHKIRSDEVGRLSGEVGRLSDEVESLRSALTKAQKEGAEIAAAIAAAEEADRELTAEREAQREAERAEREAEFLDLRNQLTKIEAAHVQVLDSTAWKATYPFRAMLNRLPALRRPTRNMVRAAGRVILGTRRR